MQTGSFIPLGENPEIYSKISQDLKGKLKIEENGILEIEGFDGKLKAKEEEGGEVEEEEEEEEEFSFVCTNSDGLQIPVDDVLQNDQICPVFPIFGRDIIFDDGEDGDWKLGKDASSPRLRLFVEEKENQSSSASESDELEALPEGTYCEWSRKAAVETSPEVCKKSNSTGHSKLWKLRDLVHRSHSDGKDAFVFLNPSAARSSTTTKPSNSAKANRDEKVKEKAVNSSSGGAEKVVIRKVKAKGSKTASSAHEKHYVMSRAKKEGDKRKSYLPYRQDLVGFFTNVSGLSKNVHPF
ncbi:DUF1645 family protein [Quillaja saponaria]|uniref:DUF1645 family protein n=1 Tax=Quillaja saponaria TaxID=32244 RepID=A0AAD7L8J9_QUISA|nr:DUF1645 family protein [Quillaja saponaria]